MVNVGQEAGAGGQGDWATRDKEIEGTEALKVLTVFGTRPEAMKLAPVIRELRRYPGRVVCRVCVTTQHCLTEKGSRGAREVAVVNGVAWV